MHYGIEVIPLGEFADPRNVVRLAQAAETAGWEALFVWDHLAFVWQVPSGDPWITLAAVAQATDRLKIGSDVTPLPRRRPQVVAHTLATLDHLSQGRAILGVGIGGVPQEFTAFGEPGEARLRAAMLDEALEVITALWSGEAVDHQGPHYTVREVTFSPLPVQRPRIPIWVGGDSPPALRRAARWDGWVFPAVNEACEFVLSPAQLADRLAFIRTHREAPGPFQVAITGCSAAGDPSQPRAYQAAGATWWLESLFGLRGSFQELLDRVRAGPAR